MNNKILRITDIPTNQNFEGYLWWSDKTAPKVLNNEQITELPKSNNPFIIEGQLYDKSNNKSYSIRFVDGDYLIRCFDLAELEGLECTDKKYLSNQLDGVQKLCFKEFWRTAEDDLCEGMEVLKPAETVFIGFKFKED